MNKIQWLRRYNNENGYARMHGICLNININSHINKIMGKKAQSLLYRCRKKTVYSRARGRLHTRWQALRSSNYTRTPWALISSLPLPLQIRSLSYGSYRNTIWIGEHLLVRQHKRSVKNTFPSSKSTSTGRLYLTNQIIIKYIGKSWWRHLLSSMRLCEIQDY